MNTKEQFTKVTPFPKYLVLIVCVLLFGCSFFVGLEYKKNMFCQSVEKNESLNMGIDEKNNQVNNDEISISENYENCFQEKDVYQTDIDTTNWNTVEIDGYSMRYPDGVFIDEYLDNWGKRNVVFSEYERGSDIEVYHLSEGRFETKRKFGFNVVYEQYSNTWWKETFSAHERCYPNPVYYTKQGDPVYVQRGGDGGATTYKYIVILHPDKDTTGQYDVNEAVAVMFSYQTYSGDYEDTNKQLNRFTVLETMIKSLEFREFETQKACLAKGTKILLVDETYKNIENIKTGDKVLSYNVAINMYIEAVVDKVIKRKDPLVIINNTLQVAPDEPIFTKGGSIKLAEDISVGDLLINEEGESVVVKLVEYKSALVDTYDFTLLNAHSFFAGGYLVRTPEL